MQLKDHQLEALAFLRRTPKAALWADMGVGKTAITLHHLRHLRDEGAGRALIVAPLKVAASVWEQEAERWGMDLTFARALGTPKQRLAAVATNSDVLIINRENLAWLVKTEAHFDTLIFDESSSFRSRKTKRWKAAWAMSKVAKFSVLLSGTPAPNTSMGLWAQYALLDGGKRLGTTLTKFRMDYFIQGGYQGYEWFERKDTAKRVAAKVDDITWRISLDDANINIDEILDIEREIELPQQAMEDYKTLERDFLLEIGKDTIDAANAASLGTKLRQISNGAVYTGENDGFVEVHDEKLEALADIYDRLRAEGRNLLVFYQFRHDLWRIKARLPEAIVLSQDASETGAWNRGEIPLLLAHPASAGHGLNLQEGGADMVFFGLPWDLELWAQARARLWRQGQKQRVRCVSLLTRGTIESKVLRVLQRKQRGQAAFLTLLGDDT